MQQIFVSLIFLIVVLLLTTFFFITSDRLNTKKNISRRISRATSIGYPQGNHKQGKQSNTKIYEKLKTLEKQLADTIFGYTRETAAHFRLRFEKAGLSAKNAPSVTLMVNCGMVFLGFLLYLFALIHFKNIAEQPFFLQILLLLVIFFVSFRLFEYSLDYLINRRYKRIQHTLSFCVDLLIICTRAGFTLDRSFEKIAEEIAPFSPDVCKEFAKISVELSVIPDRTEALRNFAVRVDTPTVNLLVSGLVHAEEQGISLGQTLSTLSQEISKQKLLEIEAKAARLPVLLTIPLALFCLPAMLMILMGPVAGSIINSSLFN